VTAVLDARNLSKVFAGQPALAAADLIIEPGEIRALAGANGSGKSTLVKILAGVYEPEPGASLEVAGERVGFGPGNSEAAGLRFVHQDLGVVGSIDTVDNLALGHGYRYMARGAISWSREVAAARDALDRLGYDIDVRRPVAELSLSERTAVAVARALSPRRADPRVLVLDEPTANLSASESQRLFDLMRRVQATGAAILFVSHHFDEIFSIADSVTVIRDGRVIDTRSIGELTEDELVAMVIGKELAAADSAGSRGAGGPVVFEARSVGGASVKGIDLAIHEGEIVGVAGITGSGREELASLLFGSRPRSGDVLVQGRVVDRDRPDLSIAAGIGLVPSDRHQNAAFLEATLRENIGVLGMDAHVDKGVLRAAREKADVQNWLRRLQIRPSRTEAIMGSLSGGNQQKVILSRWLRHRLKVLLLDDPTQGVDVGARAEIHELIVQVAREGMSVLIASSDHEELALLCHRVVIMSRGSTQQTLYAPDVTADHITVCTVSAGGRDTEASPTTDRPTGGRST
jgi:ribose transport system ATP-binding protein